MKTLLLMFFVISNCFIINAQSITGKLIDTNSVQSAISINLNGGLKILQGSLSDVWSSAAGFSASLNVSISDNKFQFILSGGYYHAEISDKFENKIDNMLSQLYGSSIKLNSLSMPLNMFPVTLGGRFFLTDGDFRPYINASIGKLYLTISDLRGAIYLSQFTDNIERQTNQEFMYNIGTGIIYQITKSCGIDFNVQYERASNEFPVYLQNSSNYISFININLGIEIHF